MIMMQQSAQSAQTAPSRRTFLKVMAASTGVLAIGSVVPVAGGSAQESAPAAFPKEPMAFVKIGSDNSVTVVVKHLDKGQGIATGLATIVAEELDADWSQIRTEFAPAQIPLYANHAFGIQGTGGSTGINNSWDELRYSGAAARQMLVAAAAAEWQVPANEIIVVKGEVIHQKSAHKANFGTLAAKAAQQPVPRDVTLKDPKSFTLIGTTNAKRVDSVDKTTGKAVFGLDIRRPGMIRAVIARAPRFGGKVKSFDAKEAKAVKGVVDVVVVPNGIAVLAKDTWSANQGRLLLKIVWDDSAAEKRSTKQILADYKATAQKEGSPAAIKGNSKSAMASAAKMVEAEYVFPYLAHAPMEPLNAVIELSANGAEIWAGSQFQTVEQGTAAAVLGLKPEQVKIHTQWAGGSFGRRATPNADYFAELASIAKAVKGKYPVQLVWTREDDITGGRYRPMFYHKMRAGLDAEGRPVAWEHRMVGQSIMTGTAFETVMIKGGVDSTSVEGAADQPYAIPNLHIDSHNTISPVPVLWWRSVGHSQNAYAVETFIDQLAHEAGKDPLAYRLGLLQGQPRLTAVLQLAADKAEWSKPIGVDRGRGIAVAESFGSSVAEVVEVSKGKDGKVKVDRVICAIDCGVAVNPDVIKAQMEGGIGYGLGAILRNQITFTDGVVDQKNFDGYLPLRISDMPKIEVYLVTSNVHPSGVGEPGLPPLGPALANAIFALSGKRLTQLPLSTSGMV
jgi:isoquinoline 1-oxidoreductase beta subunit